MKSTKSKFVNSKPQKGSALVMVVVLTVLLAAIGVLFLMTSRLDEMASSSTARNKELDMAVDSVVELISQKLTQDITQNLAAPNPQTFDYAGWGPDDDKWLSTIEPQLQLYDPMAPETYNDDFFVWPKLTDLAGYLPMYNTPNTPGGLYAVVYSPADANDIPHVSSWDPSIPVSDYLNRIIQEALVSADADGDGVTDSVWQRLPDTTGSRGEPIFAAVRIIDNCAMLNLNTAHTADPNSEGRYLSQVDYKRFLRGSDAAGNAVWYGDPANTVDPDNLLRARKADGIYDPFLDTPDVFHNDAIMNIENPGANYTLFDIADELEIRNRFMLTTNAEARFERNDVGNFTFDAGGGIYSALQMPRDTSSHPLEAWKWRLDPNNFDDTSGAYVDAAIPVDYTFKYDRRHITTFYSFDRNLRLGTYPQTDVNGDPVLMIFDPDPSAVSTNIRQWDELTQTYNFNNINSRLQVLKLLYAFRAYFLVKDGVDYKDAARKSAQLVANMIDYTDDNHPASEGPFFDMAYGSQTNANPTYIDRQIINQLIYEVSRQTVDVDGDIDGDPLNDAPQYDFGLGVDEPDETVYGYERQPFISEIVRRQHAVSGRMYAIELVNPYDTDISLDYWQIKVGNYKYTFQLGDAVIVPAASVSPTRQLGRLILKHHVDIGNFPNQFVLPGPGVAEITTGDVVELQRPDPKDTAVPPTMFITVDITESTQADYINLPTASGNYRASKRDDTAWKFTNMSVLTEDAVQTLDSPNNTAGTADAWQMPVADDNLPIGTLLDFEKVLLIGNFKDPNNLIDATNPVTQQIAAAADESEIRNDVMSPVSPLDYVCFMGRPEGNLPGRINVNTATMEVIRAAIPPNNSWNPDPDALARNIVAHRDQVAPFTRITDLINVTGFNQFLSDPNSIDDDPDIAGDFEERDWLLSAVANTLTVRSDVFTAYILVRLGHNGTQRRMIAIFDRSNVSIPTKPNQKPDKPRIIALHQVPDPR